jgi:hypothetical protein
MRKSVQTGRKDMYSEIQIISTSRPKPTQSQTCNKAERRKSTHKEITNPACKRTDTLRSDAKYGMRRNRFLIQNIRKVARLG